MNKVLLTGRLTRDPELRALASGKNVTTFSMATNEYIGNGKEKAEFRSVITWEWRPLGPTHPPGGLPARCGQPAALGGSGPLGGSGLKEAVHQRLDLR